MKPVICITHASFMPERRESLRRLLAGLRPQTEAHGIEIFLREDADGRGSLGPWLDCLHYVTGDLGRDQPAPDATHMTFLPDDAILVPHFVEVLLSIIRAKPEHIMCFQSNHVHAGKVPPEFRWYTTYDGFTGFGGTMPVAWCAEHLAWRERLRRPSEVAGDLGVNLWAMSTGRLIWKSLPSLVDHDTGIPSADGNDWHAELSPRRPVVWDPKADLRDVDWSGGGAHLGRTYTGNQWNLGRELVAPTAEDIEAMYMVCRQTPVSNTPHVVIARPLYRETAEVLDATEPSLLAVMQDLREHGVQVSMLRIAGDSLVCRMRQRAMHAMLKTDGTHLLWWDADVEARDPTCVREMLETDYDVVAGAYPLRQQDGRTVVNMHEADLQKLAAMRADEPIDMERGCVEVKDAGTGFMLVSRKAHVAMMAAHPELRHWSRAKADRNEPLWALYDTGIIDHVYESEDYMFCRRWQDMGGKVYVYLPATFRHYGVHGFEGSLLGQLGLGESTPELRANLESGTSG